MAGVRTNKKNRGGAPEVQAKLPEENRPVSGYFLLPLVMLAAALVHISALGNFFTADSWMFVYPRSLGQTFHYFWTTVISGYHGAYWLRPVPMFLFWFENLVMPRTFWLPHLTNIVFHVANVFLIWRIVEFMLAPKGDRTTAASFAAAVAALFYGVHPLTVGAVDWVAGRFDVVSATFGLAGLLAWMKWDAGTGGKRAFRLALVFFLCSIFSKEQGVVFALAAFTLTLSRALLPGGKRQISRAGLAAPIVVVAGCFLYRLIVFGGVGGYVNVRDGLSIVPALSYFAAILFPWPNVVAGWRFSPEIFAAVSCILLLGWLLRITPNATRHTLRREHLLAALAILVLGLAATMPTPGLTFAKTVAHAESRYALIPLTGFAILLGLVVSRIRTRSVHIAALAVLLLWGTVASWRTMVQVQAWRGAGIVARSIVTETVRLVPHPERNSTLILMNIPRNTVQYAYIFGIGLDYALMSAYGREDIHIVRYPTQDDLQRADPVHDAVVNFVEKTGRMERLHATWMTRGEAKDRGLLDSGNR